MRAELVRPTAEVKASYLEGERIDHEVRGLPFDWIAEAERDFDAYVAARRDVRIRHEVPSSLFWYVSGTDYLGSLVVRHALTPVLAEAGGHVGYHVVAPWRRRGHGTRMLASGLVECRRLGLERVLITCDVANEASRRIILANGGVADGQARGEDRFWVALGPDAIAAASRIDT